MEWKQKNSTSKQELVLGLRKENYLKRIKQNLAKSLTIVIHYCLVKRTIQAQHKLDKHTIQW